MAAKAAAASPPAFLPPPPPSPARKWKYRNPNQFRTSEQDEQLVTTSARLDIPIVPDDQRLGFDVREFIKQWGFNAAKGGGAHMWREVWNRRVTEIYRYVLRGCQFLFLALRF